MKYLSTTEAAALWGISARRVATLAAQGRIEGTISAGKSWLIPQDAQKPEDFRKRGSKRTSADAGDLFIFPFLLACVHSREQVRQFTPEEERLYHLCLLFEAGDFAQTRRCAEALLRDKNRYVRLGALYLLCATCIYLFDFEAAQQYYILFRTKICGMEEHRAELQLLLNELDSELVSVSEFSEKTDFTDLDAFSDDLLPAVASLQLFAACANFITDKKAIDISGYEILCRITHTQGYFYVEMCMHLYLAAYYAAADAPEKELAHLQQAVAIGVEHGTVFTLSYWISSSPDTARSVLSTYPPRLARQFAEFTKLFTGARSAYAEYQGKGAILSRLTEADYMLASLCLKNVSVEKIAEFFDITISGVNRRLSKLYRKLGVKSKRELVQVVLKSVLDLEG